MVGCVLFCVGWCGNLFVVGEFLNSGAVDVEGVIRDPCKITGDTVVNFDTLGDSVVDFNSFFDCDLSAFNVVL